MSVVNEKIKKLYDDIVGGNITIDEIKELFNSYQCYMPKDDYGKLLSELIGKVDFKIIKEILKSRKGKLFNDFKDEYGEPIVNMLILQTIFDEKYETIKEGLFDILTDEEDDYLKWDLVNNNFENALHVVCFLSNCLSKEDFLKFLNILKKHNFNPLNRDELGRNAIDNFNLRNKFSKKDKTEIINILEEMSNNFTFEVDNYVEEEVEVTVNAEV